LINAGAPQAPQPMGVDAVMAPPSLHFSQLSVRLRPFDDQSGALRIQTSVTLVRRTNSMTFRQEGFDYGGPRPDAVRKHDNLVLE
jgi:hypothetical protein